MKSIEQLMNEKLKNNLPPIKKKEEPNLELEALNNINTSIQNIKVPSPLNQENLDAKQK